MPDTDSLLTAELPRRLRGIGIPLAAVALTSFFILLGFPYHHLTNRAAAQAATSLGVEIEAEDSGFTIGFDGIGFRFRDIEVNTANGDTYPLDTLRFGPAWSLRWFLLDPILFFELDSTLGHAEGKVATGDALNARVSIRDAVLTKLPFLAQSLPVQLTGTLSADADVQTVAEEFEGPIAFDLKDGTIQSAGLPTEIAFDTVHGEVTLGGEQLVTIQAFELLGPMFNVEATGRVGKAATAPARPLEFDIHFSDILAPLRGMIQGLGAKVTANGTADLRVRGTVAAPVFQ